MGACFSSANTNDAYPTGSMKRSGHCSDLTRPSTHRRSNDREGHYSYRGR